MRRSQTERLAMSWSERGADSRDAMQWRELCAVEIGERITDPDQPRRATLRRWLIEDANLRERYAAALDYYRMRVVEAAIEQADRDVEHARGRRRIAAMRRQVIARTQWLKLIAADAEREEEREDAPDGRVAPRPFKNEGRGISDEGVAVLQRSADALGTRVASGEIVPADAPLPLSPSSSAKAEDPRVFTEPEKKLVDARPAAHSAALNQRLEPGATGSRPRHDEEKECGEKWPPPPPASAPTSNDNTDEDEPDYAPEDARYRARRRGGDTKAPPPPPDQEKKSPWKPDTPTYVRFDVGGSFDVSNQRDQGSGWDTYDPLR
jgi:hypothetical protein